MNSVMVFGALALAAVFAGSFLWASHMARNNKEEAEDLQDRVAMAHEQQRQLEGALAHAKLEYARQDGQVAALQDTIRQHSEMNRKLRDALAEADAFREELRKKLTSEIAHSRQLGDRLTGALAVVNDISQAIVEMAEHHRSSVQRLLDPDAAPAQETLPIAADPVPAAELEAELPGLAEQPDEVLTMAPDDEIEAEPEPAPKHERPLALALLDQHPAEATIN